MEVGITYDKSAYFPGEEIVATLTVSNPLPRVATIIEPFGPNAGGVYILTNENGEWRNPVDHPDSTCVACPNSIVVLQPKESRSFIVRASECRQERTFFHWGCLPVTRPGVYAFTYLYGKGARAPFQVRTATLLEMQTFRHKTTSKFRVLDLKGNPTQKFNEIPREDAAFILEAEGKRYVAITARPRQGFAPLGAGTSLAGAYGHMVGPYRLVDESTDEIRNLRLTANDREEISLTYDRGGDKGHTLQLDSSRKPLGAAK